MGAAGIGYMVGAFVGALFLTGIVVAVSSSIKASLTKLLIAVAVLTVGSIFASYYGNADGAPVDFPPPMEQFFGFEAVLRLASFGAAFLVFSIPLLTGYWKNPNEGTSVYGDLNLRMSKLAVPIAIASFIPLMWHLYQNRAPESGLQVYQTIAPDTLALLDDLDPQFRERAEEAIRLHRLATSVLTPRTQSDFAAEVGVVAEQIQKLTEGRSRFALRAPANVQGDLLRAMADGSEWFAKNQTSYCVDFLAQGWGSFVDRFAPESHPLLDRQIRATVNAVVPNWNGEISPDVQDGDLTQVGNLWVTETAPALGYSRERAVAAAEAFDKILFGEPVNDCQGFADILRMIAEKDQPAIARVRAALAFAYVSTP